MRPALALSILLVASLSVPPVAAQGGGEDVDCGDIVQTGVVPWTLCMAAAVRDAAEGAADDVLGLVPGVLCAAWWLVWGPGASCPFSPPA